MSLGVNYTVMPDSILL